MDYNIARPLFTYSHLGSPSLKPNLRLGSASLQIEASHNCYLTRIPQQTYTWHPHIQEWITMATRARPQHHRAIRSSPTDFISTATQTPPSQVPQYVCLISNQRGDWPGKACQPDDIRWLHTLRNLWLQCNARQFLPSSNIEQIPCRTHIQRIGREGQEKETEWCFQIWCWEGDDSKHAHGTSQTSSTVKHEAYCVAA